MGKTKYVDVNNHRAHIWDDALNVVFAHIIEVQSAMGISDEDLSGWIVHASLGGDSLVFSYSQAHYPHHSIMLDVVDTARERIIAMGDVTPEIVADWTLGPDNKRVSGGTLRGNEPIEVDRLLEVVDWIDRALRSDPYLEQNLVVGDRHRP